MNPGKKNKVLAAATAIVLCLFLFQSTTKSSKNIYSEEPSEKFVIAGKTDAGEVEEKNIYQSEFNTRAVLLPIFGQYSVYQAEDPGEWNKRFPGYGYMESKTGRDTVEIINGEYVISRCCIKSAGDKAGFIVSGLYENCEQVNNTEEVAYNDINSVKDYLSDIKYRKYNNRWYIRPRIKIDSTYAKTHMRDTVALVIVKGFDGNTLDTFSITCLNFVRISPDGVPFYDGSYLENYNNYSVPGLGDAYMSVGANKLTEGKRNNPFYESKVDYSIFWCGNVDMFLDCITVMDSRAYELLNTNDEEELFSQYRIFKIRMNLRRETERMNRGQTVVNIGEIGYNNLKCVGKITELINEYSGGRILLGISSDTRNLAKYSGLRNCPDAGRMVAAKEF